MNAENITYLDIKKLVPAWAEEYGIDEYEEMHFPFSPEVAGSQNQALWSLVDTGHVSSVRGLKLYYERYADTIKARSGECVQRVAY